MNLFATTASVVIVAPLPGVMPEHVEITLDGPTLHIRAARGAEANREYLLHEWDVRAFERTLDLPEGAGWPVTASLAHGQLTITLARSADTPGDTHLVVRPSTTAASDPRRRHRPAPGRRRTPPSGRRRRRGRRRALTSRIPRPVRGRDRGASPTLEPPP